MVSHQSHLLGILSASVSSWGLVGENLPRVHLLQVLPPTLTKRAPFLPLKSRQLSPSFFDAPGSWYYVRGQQPNEPVVIAFLYIGGAKVLRRVPYYHESVELLTTFVQGLFPQFNGYECEEKEGNFLLAFRSADQAAQFAITVQRDAMALPWPDRILEEELAAEILKSSDGNGVGSPPESDVVVFSDVQPHRTTGRAAYFGPIVNRAARIAATAACGQTLANDLLFESIKGSCPAGVCFKELGKFDLKGVKESMHLYQISCPELSARLFPRTLRLATPMTPMFPSPLPSGLGATDDDKWGSLDCSVGDLSISIHSDINVMVRSPRASMTTDAPVTQVDHKVHAVMASPIQLPRPSLADSAMMLTLCEGAKYSQVKCDSETDSKAPMALPIVGSHRSFTARTASLRTPQGLEGQIRAEVRDCSYEELLQKYVRLRIDAARSPRLFSFGVTSRRSADFTL
eukprot:jgi/Mesvir1/9947/Mv08621-RA.1